MFSSILINFGVFLNRQLTQETELLHADIEAQEQLRMDLDRTICEAEKVKLDENFIKSELFLFSGAYIITLH